jgi:hypothetical protein
MSVIPWALAQHSERIAPVCVLQVLSATPDQPSARPSRTKRQSCALSSMNNGFRADTAWTSIRCASRSYGNGCST